MLRLLALLHLLSVPPHQRRALSARWRLLWSGEQQHRAAGTRGRAGPASITIIGIMQSVAGEISVCKMGG